MLVSRFDGTEKNCKEMIIKLAGPNNNASQNILLSVMYYSWSYGEIYMKRIDRLGLYDEHIEMLFRSCKGIVENFISVISKLYLSEFPQEKIMSMKTQEEFDKLVKEHH